MRMWIVVPIVGAALLMLANGFSVQCQESASKQDGAAQPDMTEPGRLWEHRGSVLTMEFTRAGDRLVTGGAARGESVVVWDVKTGKRLLGLKDAGLVYSLAISPDGKKIATAAYSGIEKEEPTPRTAVWDAATGQKLFSLKNERAGQRPCIAFSPDGKLLATGTVTGGEEDSAGAIQLYHAETGKKAGDPLVGPLESFSHVQFSPDGKTLAAASWGEATFVVLWDVETRKQRAILKIKKTWSLIRALAFSPDSTRLAWAAGNEVGGNAEHTLWDAITGKRMGSLRTDALLGWVAFDAQAKSLLTVDLGGRFQRWNTTDLKRSSGFHVELEFPTMVQSAAMSPDGKTLALGTGNSDALALPRPDYGTIRVFDAMTGRERLAPEKEVQRAKEEAEEAARLAAGAKAQSERAAQEREELAKLPAAARAKIQRASAAASRLRYALHLNQAQQALERGHLAAANVLLDQYEPQAGSPDLRSFEWHYLRRQCQFHRVELEQPEVIYASWEGAQPRLSPDGKTLAVANVEHDVILWDVVTGKQGATLKMPGPIWHMAFSPDCKYVLTAGGNQRPDPPAPSVPEKDDPSSRVAILWEVSTGKQLAKFAGSKIVIGAVAFAANGKSVAIGDWQGTVRLFEVPSGKATTALPVGADFANALAFSPDGSTLAVGGFHGAVSLWNLASEKPTKIQQGNKTPIIALQFDRSGKTLYAAEGDWPTNNVARRFSRMESGEWRQTREWKQVHHLALSPDGARLALSGWHGVVLWDTTDDREVARIVPRVTGDGLNSRLAFAPDSKTLLVYANHIRGQPEYILFDADSGQRLGAADNLSPDTSADVIYLSQGGKMIAITGDRYGDNRSRVVLQATLGQTERIRQYDEPMTPGKITSLAFSSDSQQLVVSNSASVFVWKLQTDEQRKISRSNNLPIQTVAFAADGKAVLSSDPSGVKIWDAESSKERAHIKAYYGSIGTNGASVYVTKGDHTIAVFSASDGKPFATMSPKDAIKPAQGKDEARGDVVASSGGKWAVSPGPLLFDVAAKKEIKRWVRDPIPIRFAFTPDEKMLLTTDRQGTLIVWELPILKERHVVPKGGTVLAVSPDNHTAIVQQTDGALALFDLRSATALARLDGLSARATQIAFSPDGRSLVTGNRDGMLCFWCPLTGAQRLSLRGHGGPVSSLAFSPSGAILATGSNLTVSLRFAH